MYIFAFFLVLYEFTTYSANDMIMPGMLAVVAQFNASQYYVALSMGLYIFGNCAFLLLTGLCAEKFGKRKIILIGNFLFFIFIVAAIYSHSIHEFMIFRFLQGGGMAIIAIGYALIHHRFDDKSAVKIIALMSNVSLLAPLLGPAMGSAIISVSSWETIFIVSAIFSVISLIGLTYSTPKDYLPSKLPSLGFIMKQYISILFHKEFLKGTLCLVFSSLTILVWISQAPNFILAKQHHNYLHYTLYQLTSMAGLCIATLLIQYAVGRYKLYTIVSFGNLLSLLGVVISLIGFFSINIVVAGLFFYTLGLGLLCGCIMRLVMSIKGYSQGMLSTMTIFLQAFLFSAVIALSNVYLDYFNFSLLSFTLLAFAFGVINFILTYRYIKSYKLRGWQ